MPVNVFTALENERTRAVDGVGSVLLHPALAAVLRHPPQTAAAGENQQAEAGYEAALALARTSSGGSGLAADGADDALEAGAASSGPPSGWLNNVRDSKVQEWLQIAKRSQIGPKLRGLREEHERAGLPLEHYSMAHVYQLGSAQRPWVQQPRVYCKNIHRKRDPQGRNTRCTQCTTCHWCRQKTTCSKTQCSACHGNRDNAYGGPFAGVICGNCLWTRFGENLNEALDNPNWTCPACRQICNCSANNCVRNRAGWICTDQINTEATSLGYESVAHYLVLAQLDKSLWAHITDNVNTLQPLVAKETVKRAAAVKRQRSEKGEAAKLHEMAAQKVEMELAAVRAAAGFSAQRALMVANSNQKLLVELGFGRTTLAADLLDDDESDDDGGDQNSGTHVATQVSFGNPAMGCAKQSAYRRPHGIERQLMERQLHSITTTHASVCHLPSSSLSSGMWAVHRLPPRLPQQPPPQAVQRGLPTPTNTGDGGDAQVQEHDVFLSLKIAQGHNLSSMAPASGGSLQPASYASEARGVRFGFGQEAEQLPGINAGCPAAASQAVAVNGAVMAPIRSDLGSTLDARQHQLGELLHQDRSATFPLRLPAGSGVPHSIKATRQHGFNTVRQLKAATLQGAVANQLLQQRPSEALAASCSKQQKGPALQPSAGHPPLFNFSLEVKKQGAAAPELSGSASELDQQHKLVHCTTAGSPIAAAESSQQLGLSPAVATHAMGPSMSAECAEQVGAGPMVRCGEAGASPMPVPASSTPLPAHSHGPLSADLAAEAAAGWQHSGYALEWGHLLCTAEALLEEMQHNDCRDLLYQPDLTVNTEHAAEDQYCKVYNANVKALQDLLVAANKQLLKPLVVGNDRPCETDEVLLIDGLRPLLKLYIILARVLPADVVVLQIVPRLLGQDCFVDFDRSNCAARWMLLDGMLELLRILHQRRLCIKATCQVIASSVATVATELHDTSELLSEVLDAVQGSSVQQLPARDRYIGVYYYDAAERRKELRAIYSDLEANYRVLEEFLHICLNECLSAARDLGCDGGLLLQFPMMVSLLSSERSLPRSIKHDGLAFLFTIVSLASINREHQPFLNLSVIETNQQRGQRLELCKVVRELLPLLEGLVTAEYPLWRPAACISASAPPLIVPPSAAAATTISTNPGVTEGHKHLGQEAMTALARAYGFLLECQQITWQQLQEAIFRPYTGPLSFWQYSNRMYRCFCMAMLAETLRHTTSFLTVDDDSRVWLLKHWLLSLLDRGRRFTTAESLTTAFSRHLQLGGLFANLPPDQLAIGNDRNGQRTARLLEVVFQRLCAEPLWRRLLGSLLQGVDELLDRRAKETVGSEAHSDQDRLRYGSRLYTLLSAILQPVADTMPLNAPVAAVAQGRSAGRTGGAVGLTGLLHQLAQRMALLAIGSCLAVYKDIHASSAGVAAEDSYEDAIALRRKGDIRERLQKLPFGALTSLWRVLLALGAPQAFSTDKTLLSPLWTVVCGSIELCSGCFEATTFDEVLLEYLAKSLLESTGGQHSNGVSQLWEYVLATFVRRYLSRSHWLHPRNERAAVNSIRFLHAFLGTAHGTAGVDIQAVLLPLLQPLLGALWPLERDAKPSLAVRHAVHRMLAKLLERCPQILPPLEPVPTQPAQQALHTFWFAAIEDAMLCCQQPVVPQLGALQQGQLLTKMAERRASLSLAPLSREAAVDASNKLFRLLEPAKYSSHLLEQVWQQQGPHLELMLREALPGSMEQGSGRSHSDDLCWKAACTALQIVEAFLKAEMPSTTPLAASDYSLQRLSPGNQWAWACIQVLHILMVVGGSKAGQLKKLYADLQRKACTAMPDRFQQPKQSAQQLQKPALAPVLAPIPAFSTVAAMPCQPQFKQEAPFQAAEKQQALRLKQEQMLQQQTSPQATRQHLAKPKQKLARQCAQPNQSPQPITRDMPFKDLASLTAHCTLVTVGMLAKQPEVKNLKNMSAVLKLELWDQQRAKLVLMVPHELELYQQLLEEATLRLNSNAREKCVMRVVDAVLLDSSKAASTSGSSSAAQPLTCMLQERSSVEWEPAGGLADELRQAVAASRLTKGQQHVKMATACMPKGLGIPGSLLTQATLPIQWEEQSQSQWASVHHPPLACPPLCTAQVEAPTQQHNRKGAPMLCLQGELSQAAQSTAACTQQPDENGAAAGDLWRQLASQVVVLLKDLPRDKVIHAMTSLAPSVAGSVHEMLAQGPQHVAGLVRSLLT